MKFCDLVQFMHHNYETKMNAAEFVKILTDAILDDEALEKDSPNPLYGLGKSTLEAYYSGRLPISQKKASALTPRLDEAKFADFVNTYSFDALNHMKDKLAEFGFDVEPSEVGQACANILAQIIRRRSEGLSDDVTALNYQRMETGRSLKNIAPATIERRGDKLHISGEVITIHQALVPDDVGNPDNGNMLIHGDNLIALQALQQDYAGKIKCIYIDPPYNTGSAFEYYDDGLEHSEWLQMMHPRLQLLRNLLSDDGSIWIQIDDEEQAYLKVMCDEIFGRANFVNMISVNMKNTSLRYEQRRTLADGFANHRRQY